MGNDGGSIPKRRELVKNAARAPTVSELKATAHESQAHAWSVCPLSAEALDLESAVSDFRGRLYAYESVLRGLTADRPAADAAEDGGDGAGHTGVSFASTGIKSLRDVVRLKCHRAGAAGGPGKKDVFTCPVSMKELGPSTKAVYLVPCGHVFAEIAVREISSENSKEARVCPECSEAFEADNVIPILPTEKADKERLESRIEGLRVKGLTHSLKKDKSAGGAGDKKKKKKRSAEEAGAADRGDAVSKDKAKTKEEKIDSRLSGINNPMTASLTAKVLAEQDERNKRRKLAAMV